MSIEVEDVSEEPAACEACQVFESHRTVPQGEHHVALCALCFHNVTEHGCSLASAPQNVCECDQTLIYPDREPQEN